MKTLFRFDDISINTDISAVKEMGEFITNNFEDVQIILCISPMVHDLTHEVGKHRQRVFPVGLREHTDHRVFFRVDKMGMPDVDIRGAVLASHGLIHIDHRLLTKEEQELSILVSCSLTKSKIFVPPFNKWDSNTEVVCSEHDIELIKFEDGWLSMEHNRFNEHHSKWYLHSREFSPATFKEWFRK